jgi:tagatose 1,6-diphosphate aldolase
VRYSGVLCGRATWKEGIPVFAKEGSAAFRAWLETKGVENIANVNEAVRPASPWFSVYGAASADALA